LVGINDFASKVCGKIVFLEFLVARSKQGNDGGRKDEYVV
jgi:hypothetical protein